MMDLDVSTLINGGAGLAALYLGIQIKGMLKALDARVTQLEGHVYKSKPSPKAKARSTRKSAQWH